MFGDVPLMFLLRFFILVAIFMEPFKSLLFSKWLGSRSKPALWLLQPRCTFLEYHRFHLQMLSVMAQVVVLPEYRCSGRGSWGDVSSMVWPCSKSFFIFGAFFGVCFVVSRFVFFVKLGHSMLLVGALLVFLCCVGGCLFFMVESELKSMVTVDPAVSRLLEHDLTSLFNARPMRNCRDGF